MTLCHGLPCGALSSAFQPNQLSSARHGPRILGAWLLHIIIIIIIILLIDDGLAC